MTHGWGAKKKHRGAGNRGGRGMAGSGKRADQRKPGILKLKNYFGKHGFTPRSRIEVRCISVEELGKFGKEILNLQELGYDKLLANGRPSGKFIVTVQFATEKAIKRIVEAGGSVKLLAE